MKIINNSGRKPFSGLLKTSILMFMLGLMVIPFSVQAQQNLYDYESFTPYEKQRSDLAGEAGKKVYDALSEQDKLGFTMLTMSAAKDAKNDYELMLGIENILCTMFGVASLTNPEKADSYYDYRLTIQMQTIAKWYFDARTEIEKQKTALDVEREKERLSGFYALKQDIKTEFLEWSTKGTYEKKEDYVKRIQEQGVSAFDSICYKLCLKQYFDNIKIEPIGYDVDNESYSIKTYYIVNKQETVPVILKTKMLVEAAKVYRFPYFIRDYMVPVNLYYHDGFLCSDKVFDIENKYYFESNVTSNEPVEITYDGLNISNDDLNLVLNGYAFDYKKYIIHVISLADSIDNHISILKQKLEVLKSLCGNYGPWGHYDLYGRWSEIYWNYNHIKEPWGVKKRMDKVNEYEQTCIEYIQNNFSAYRPFFESEDDFIRFFFNEKGVDIRALEQLIQQKFDSFVSSIGDAKGLKMSKDTPIGDEMLGFCVLSRNSRIGENHVFLATDYVENMLKEFVMQNKVLKRRFEDPYDSNSKYASYVIARYVIKGK